MQIVFRQRLNKHVPENTQQWELCYLWAMLQLVARLPIILTKGSVFYVVRAEDLRIRGSRITEESVVAEKP
jgi:hypothetical protein